MDMSATCVMCGKKSQDYAIECSCCGNFFCTEECKVRAHQKKTIHYTWLDYKHLYEKIMSDPQVRVVTICDLNGEIMYSGHRQGTKNMLTPEESRNSLELAVRSWKTRSQLASKIGKGKYVLAEYEKVKRITMPLGDNHLLYITTNVECSHTQLIDMVRNSKWQ